MKGGGDGGENGGAEGRGRVASWLLGMDAPDYSH